MKTLDLNHFCIFQKIEEQKTTQGCIGKEIKDAGTAFVEAMHLAASQCLPGMENQRPDIKNE